MPPWFEITLTALLGLGLGSFSTALAWREARQLPWWKGRSACPHCAASLGLRDLIPVFSWLFYRGKCRRCRAPVSLRYPLTETGVALACLGVYAAWGLTTAAACIMLAVPFLAALVVVDSERMILPDRLMILCALPAPVFIWLTAGGSPLQAVAFHLGAAVLYAAVIWVTGKITSFFLKKESLGFGDVKFLALAGLWLGPLWLPFYLIVSGFAGILWGIAWRLAHGKPVFPFGPALVCGLYICLLLKGWGFSGSFALYWL